MIYVISSCCQKENSEVLQLQNKKKCGKSCLIMMLK